MFAPSFALLFLPWASPVQLPLMELRASYPYGEQLCIEATPNNQRAFVALGSAISILDVSTLPGGSVPVIDRVELPDASPVSMLYFEHQFGGTPLPPLQRWLFIA